MNDGYSPARRPRPYPTRSTPLPEVDRSGWRKPWVHLKYYSFHPQIFPSMIRDVSADARPGSLVQVYDKEDKPFGVGLWNPRSRVPLRMFHHGPDQVGEEQFEGLIDRALDLRLNLMRPGENTDAYRVVHSDGDGLSGLIVDRFADVLSVQVHSLGIWQRLPSLLARLHARLGTKRIVVDVDPEVARNEGIRPGEIQSDDVRTVKIRENGLRYEVDFTSGHKTGFFCDQRDNRQKLTHWVQGRRMLDLCSYTGGFSISARVNGGAAEVTAVDLDEKAILQAKRNANLNNAKINWVHCDAYSFARQMRKDGKKFDVVLLDPPKLVFSREDEMEGMRRYEDLNILGISITEPGGLLVTCSCSGLLGADEFERMVIRAGHKIDRKLQILDRTGAGLDHPVLSNCPEGRYLKLIWARVW